MSRRFGNCRAWTKRNWTSSFRILIPLRRRSCWHFCGALTTRCCTPVRSDCCAASLGNPPGGQAGLPARPHDLCQRSEQDGERVAGSAGRSARLQTAREDEPNPHHPGPPASLRAALLRSVRRHRGAARRRTPPSWQDAICDRPPRQLRLAGEATVAAVCHLAPPFPCRPSRLRASWPVPSLRGVPGRGLWSGTVLALSRRRSSHEVSCRQCLQGDSVLVVASSL